MDYQIIGLYCLIVIAVFQAPAEQQKFHGRGNVGSPRKPTYQHKTGPKHHGPNGAAPFPVPLTYYPPVTPLYHTMVPVPPIPTPGYPHPFPSGAFARGDGRFVRPGTDVPSKSFVRPANGDFQSPLHANSSAYESNSVERGSNPKDQDGHMDPSRSTQRPAAMNHNFHAQQPMGPRYFIRPFPGPAGFVSGANFPGS